MKKFVIKSGSLRTESTNLKIIEYVSRLAAKRLTFSVYQGLSAPPAFNPDLDGEGATPPAEVTDFRCRIKAADGVLICTPEYVFAVPGALKNVIDWTVSSGEFMNKPTALITASGLGEKAHESLLLTLKNPSSGNRRKLRAAHLARSHKNKCERRNNGCRECRGVKIIDSILDANGK